MFKYGFSPLYARSLIVLLMSLYDVVFFKLALRRVPTVLERGRPERDAAKGQKRQGRQKLGAYHISPALAV